MGYLTQILTCILGAFGAFFGLEGIRRVRPIWGKVLLFVAASSLYAVGITTLLARLGGGGSEAGSMVGLVVGSFVWASWDSVRSERETEDRDR